MSGVFTKISGLPVKFPLLRGMLSYGTIWPTCSLVQEYLEHGTTLTEANWARAARFSIFGTFFMAPVFYGWMKYSNRFFKKTGLMAAISRAVVEQFTYSPLAMAYFFFGMSMLEGKPYKVCVNEVKEKFWPTYKISAVFWPAAQTFNFYLISEKNRIVFVSAVSFVWTVYLAHVKGGKQKNDGHFIATDSQPLNVEPMSANLNVEKDDVESVLDKAYLVGVDLSSGLMNQKPAVVVESDVEVKTEAISDVASEKEKVVLDNSESEQTKILANEHPQTDVVGENLEGKIEENAIDSPKLFASVA